MWKCFSEFFMILLSSNIKSQVASNALADILTLTWGCWGSNIYRQFLLITVSIWKYVSQQWNCIRECNKNVAAMPETEVIQVLTQEC